MRTSLPMRHCASAPHTAFPGGVRHTPQREHRQLITAGPETLGDFNAVVGPAASSRDGATTVQPENSVTAHFILPFPRVRSGRAKRPRFVVLNDLHWVPALTLRPACH
jgi:hypothetical protein